MAYRKRIKIAKGLSVNLSGSGASLTLGRKGTSVNIGKKGTYLNTGIPGTGIYNRKKIGGTQNKTSEYNRNNTSSSQLEIKVHLNLDEKGKPILKLTDSIGREITDESIIRKVKKSEQYKQGVEQLMDDKKNEIENNLKSFIEIYKSTPELYQTIHIKEQLETLKPQKYLKKDYLEPAPLIKDVKIELEIEARNTINKIFFWKNRKLREEFVKKNCNLRLENKNQNWEERKKHFEEEQILIEKKENIILQNQFEKKIVELNNYLDGYEDFVTERAEVILNEITLPVDFSLNFEYNKEKSLFLIDLDLPEIEDMPTKKVNTLASGKISVKNKTQKEIKQEYALCVCGISFYFSGLFFNISSNINTIQISGYTQRVNKKNGNIEDDYIYSTKFTRDIFETINFKQINPIEAFTNFDHRMNILKSFEMKTIKPLEAE